ncbi:putative disease resistance protein RGA1 [Musa acuminata AAA Group]|uniref:putative disease resistance protein RGA1 n=1 Tax=Musa acuminata AAA Group TaxID=214697 RepID=UPI0031D0109E
MTVDLDLKRVLLEVLPSSAVRAQVEELGVRNHAEMIRGRLWVIHGVIMDAQLRAMEELVLEARVKDVGDWVTDVRVAVLDFEGLLGRIVTWQPTGTFNRLQRCYSLDDDDKGASRDAILIKLKDTAARLNILVSRARGLNLRKEMMESMDPCEVEFSTILKAEIVGRDEVIEDFIGKIRQRQQVSTGSVPLIVNIKGRKGMGKTTVARMIYHHRWAREQFSHRIWVDSPGSLFFDPMRIATHLADSMTKKPCSHLERHLHGIWKLVNESLRGSKYLLVLNDIRRENSEGDNWDKLHNILLREGGAGSTVIIVSSEDGIFKPRMMEFDVPGLSEKHWEQVFVRHAVIHPEEEEEASSAAKLLPRDILLHGNPLHAKLLASVFFRLTERSRWEEMAGAVRTDKSIDYFDPFHLLDYPTGRDATEEKLSHDEGSKPLSSGYVQSPPVPRFVNLRFFSLYLLLSRDERRHLYYSFFPPGYTFDFQDLLQMLTAEGFIPHSTDKAAAIEHLQREVQSSMSRTSRFSVLDHYCGQLCLPVDRKIRALLMPLPYFLRPSILIVEEENALMDRKCQTAQIPQHESTKLTGVHVLDPLATQILKLPEEHQLLNLRYLNLSQTKLKKFPDPICYLRNLLTLKLAHCQQLKQLPEQIHDLGKLQVLNLAYCTKLRKLPKTITSLVNLQELDLEGCHSLIELPQGLNNMKSLTELNLHRCSSLTRMPRKMKQLRNLQKLSGYTAVDNLGKAIREMHALVNLEELLHQRNLEELLHLRSLEELHLRSLEGVSKPEDAEAAKLEEKPNLRSLALQWGCQKMDDGTEASAGSSSSEVIEALRPNISLRKLEIIAYTGEAFPSWMGIKQEYHCTLVEIKLINLRRCGSLPALGELARLKIVEISGMQKISSVDDKFYGDNGRFSTLEKLTFSEMPNLEKWQTVVRKQDLFPKLAELTLIECPKLAKLEVRLSQVKRLNVWLDNGRLWTPTPSNFEGWDNLEELEMVGCTQLRSLPEDIKNFKCLESLRLVGCENLISLPDWLKGYEETLPLKISDGTALILVPKASNLLEDHPSLHRTYEVYQHHYNRFDMTDTDDEEEDHPNLPHTDEDHQERHNLSDKTDEDRHSSPDN